jgi:retinol dehydrogenase-12
MQGNVVHAKELARRHGDKLVATSCNPGNLKTDLQRHLPSWQHWFIVRPAAYLA